MLCVFGVILAFVAVLKYVLFILFPTVHRKTNFLVNLYGDNKYSDSDNLIRRSRLVHWYRHPCFQPGASSLGNLMRGLVFCACVHCKIVFRGGQPLKEL